MMPLKGLHACLPFAVVNPSPQPPQWLAVECFKIYAPRWVFTLPPPLLADDSDADERRPKRGKKAPAGAAAGKGKGGSAAPSASGPAASAGGAQAASKGAGKGKGASAKGEVNGPSTSRAAAAAASKAAAKAAVAAEDSEATEDDADMQQHAAPSAGAAGASAAAAGANINNGTRGPNPKGGRGGGGVAISMTGHTCRGRVKQKGVKRADLLEVGTVIARPGWYNAGYIFPAGFKARTLFRSSVNLEALTIHECEIQGEGGQYWPAPTFIVTALDRADEPLVARSCTGCWTQVLKRINSEIEGRRQAGEDLPPPPKTAIAGPEYFGLNQPEIIAAIEAQDAQQKCAEYWEGKQDRLAAMEGIPVPVREKPQREGAAPRAPREPRPPREPREPREARAGGGRGGKRGRRRGSDDDGDDDLEEAYAGNRWSGVSRNERYRKRCEDAGEDTTHLDADNPLPGTIDPITLEVGRSGHLCACVRAWLTVLGDGGTLVELLLLQ